MNEMTTRRRKKIRSVEGYDRLTSLPDPIREHILSFLPTQDAARTTFLSKSWRLLWTQVPSVDFSLSDRYLNTDWLKAGIIRMRELFCNFIDFALETLLVVEKFKLCVPCYDSKLKSRVDKWVDRAFEYQLKEFELCVKYKSTYPPYLYRYVLPKIIFGSTLIRKVTLTNCGVNESSVRDIDLPLLYYLSLSSVYIEEQELGKIFANCPNLEDFTFDTCEGLRRLEISGCEKLKKLNIKYNKKPLAIEISAPNLIELNYMYYGEEGDCKIELIGCTRMKKFRATGASLDVLKFHSLLESFPALEVLDLDRCDRLQHVEISSPQLVYLAFRRCKWLETADVNTPNLKYFHYEGVNPIQFLPRDLTPRLNKATIYLSRWNNGNKWHDNLVKFLTMLRHCERLTLRVPTTKGLIIPKSFRKKTTPPISGVKHFTVKLDASVRQIINVDFIEGLLWLAPCPETISISDYHSRIYKSFQFKYETPSKCRETCGCWNSLPIHCWRHSLNKVSIQVKKKMKDDIKLPDFFQNAKSHGKMVECSVLN